MEFKVIEVDNLFECYQDLLHSLKHDKREMCYFEDCKNQSSSALISIVK